MLQLDRTTSPRAVSIPPQENRAAEALFFLTRICALYRVFNSSGVNGGVFMFFASLLSSLMFSLYKQPACCVSVHGILEAKHALAGTYRGNPDLAIFTTNLDALSQSTPKYCVSSHGDAVPFVAFPRCPRYTTPVESETGTT